MFKVQEGYHSPHITEKGDEKDFSSLSLIKEFKSYQEAETYVISLINEKPQNNYVRLLIGKRYVGFDYGSWSHFYFITSDEPLNYEDLYDFWEVKNEY